MKFIEQLSSKILLEGVIEDAKKNFADRYSPEHIDEVVEKALPDNNKKYLPWVMKHYSNGNIASSDFPKVKNLLTAYDNNKSNIGVSLSGVNGLHHLHEIAHPYLNYAATASDKASRTAKTEYEDTNLLIQSHKGHKAVIEAAKLDRGNPIYNSTHQPGKAEWCVSADNTTGRDYLNDYTNNQRLKFYTITRKTDKRKYAIIPDNSSTPEFRDEKDSSVSPESFVFKNPSILDSNLGKQFKGHILEEDDRVLGAYSHIKKAKIPYDQLSGNDIENIYKGYDGGREDLDNFFVHHPNTPHSILKGVNNSDVSQSSIGANYAHKNFDVEDHLKNPSINNNGFLEHARLNDSHVVGILKSSLENGDNNINETAKSIIFNKNKEDISADTIRSLVRHLHPYQRHLKAILQHKNLPPHMAANIIINHLPDTSNIPSTLFSNEAVKKLLIDHINNSNDIDRSVLFSKKLHPDIVHKVLKHTNNLNDIPTHFDEECKIHPKTFKALLNKFPGNDKIQQSLKSYTFDGCPQHSNEEKKEFFNLLTTRLNTENLANTYINTLVKLNPDESHNIIRDKLESDRTRRKTLLQYDYSNPKANNVIAEYFKGNQDISTMADALNNSDTSSNVLDSVINKHSTLFPEQVLKHPNSPEHMLSTLLDKDKINDFKEFYSRDNLSENFLKNAINTHSQRVQRRGVMEALNSPSATPEIQRYFLKLTNNPCIDSGILALSKMKSLHPSVIQPLVNHPNIRDNVSVVKNLLKNKELDEVNLTRLAKNAKSTFKDRGAYDLLVKHPNLTKDALDSIIGQTANSNNFIPEQDRNHAIRLLHEKLGQLSLPFKVKRN